MEKGGGKPATGRGDDTSKETTGEADDFVSGTAVCVMDDMGRVEGTGTSNLRTKSPSTRVNGIYFGKLGSRIRSLWGKIIRGVRPDNMICFPRDIVAKDERK